MSGQSAAMDALPQEMWLRIFALVDSKKALGCVVLVCRKFQILGMEALLRHISWRSTTVAINHLEFWDRNPSKAHLVRSVYFSLAESGSGAEDDYPRIFGCIQSFSKLKHIKLEFGPLPNVLYPTLQNLPSVSHLTLQSCSIPPAPEFFPYSFPSPVPPPPIQLTNLTISKLRPSQHTNFILDAVTVPIAYHLPNLRSFETDTIGIQIPTEVSAQLASLTIALHGVAGDIQPRLDVLLQRMPRLTALDVSVATNGHHAPHGTAANAVSPQPSPPLAELRTLSVPWPAAGHIVPGAPAIAHLRVTSAIPKASDAVWLLERLRGAPLRAIALHLQAWDDEVLLASARCVPGCEALEIVYQDGGPTDDFLFNLGIHHLPLLRALHTLRLFAMPRPPVASPSPRFVWEPTPMHLTIDGVAMTSVEGAEEEEGEEFDDPEADEREAEATAAMRECVHAWARYNPALARVQLGSEEGPPRTWVRKGHRWDTDIEDEEQRAEAWAAICAAG